MPQTWSIHFFFDDTASPPLHRFRPVQAKGFGDAGHSACVANSPATLRNGGSGAQCGDCNKDTRSWPCFDTCSVSLIRVANAAAVFDGFFLGPSTRAVSQIAEWLGGFLVTCSWRSGAIAERDERTHSQAGVLIILLHRKGGSELQGFF